MLFLAQECQNKMPTLTDLLFLVLAEQVQVVYQDIWL